MYSSDAEQILSDIKRVGDSDASHSGYDSHVSSGHAYYGLSIPERRTIAKQWAAEHRQMRVDEFQSILDALFQGPSFEEKCIAGTLLQYLPKQRKQLDPVCLDGWLDCLHGWAEIDTLCQSNFSAEELLGRWEDWERLLRGFAAGPNIGKRRASLVLLTGAVTKSDAKELVDLSFALIEQLSHEQAILITKAIS